MKLRDFMVAIGYLPATVFSGMVSITFGSTQTDDDENTVLNEKTGEPEVTPSLLGLILDSIKAVGQGIGDFIASHKKAIATAAWLTLLLAGATALTLFLWPAALTAVATFAIANISILSVVGTNTALQIIAASGLVAAAVSTAVYLVASVANTINWIKECFTKRPDQGKDSEKEDLLDHENSSDDDYDDDSTVQMTRMMPKQHETSDKPAVKPHNSIAPLSRKGSPANSDIELNEDKAANLS